MSRNEQVVHPQAFAQPVLQSSTQQLEGHVDLFKCVFIKTAERAANVSPHAARNQHQPAKTSDSSPVRLAFQVLPSISCAEFTDR